MKTALSIIFFLTAFLLCAQSPVVVSRQEGHMGFVDFVRFSPNGQLALSKSESETVLWDMSTGKFVRFVDIPGAKSVLCFSPNGQGVIGIREDGKLVSWDLFAEDFVWQMQLPGTPVTTQVSPDERTLAVLFTDRIWCVNLADGQLRWQKKWTKTPNTYPMLHFSADCATLTIRTGTTGKPVGAFDAMTGRKRKRLRFEEVWQSDSLLFVKNDKIALLTADRETLQLIDYQNNLTVSLPRFDMPVTDFAFSPGGSKVLIALGGKPVFILISPGRPAKRSGSGALLVWDVQNEYMTHQMEGIAEGVLSIDISADGTRCLAAGYDSRVYLWNVEDGKALFRMERDVVMETNIQFTPDVRIAAMSKFDASIKTWNLEQRDKLFFHPEEGAETFALSPDGKMLLRSDHRHSPDLLEMDTLKTLGKLKDRHQCIWVGTAIDISPDGKMALIGSSQEWRVLSQPRFPPIPGDSVRNFVLGPLQDTIGINMRGDTLYGRVKVSSNPVTREVNSDTETRTETVLEYSVDFSPDFFNVSLWDLEKKESVRVFPVFNHDWHPISAVRFSPDGRHGIARVLDRAMEYRDGYGSYLENKLMGWELATGRALENPFGKNAFHAVRFEGPEPRAATIGPDNTATGSPPIGTVVTEWALADGQIKQQYVHDSLVKAVAFHPDGQKICTLTQDDELTEWDTQTGKKVRQLEGVAASEYLTYAPDPNFVVVGKGVKTIWNLGTGKATLEIGNLNRNADDLFFEDHSALQVSQLQFLPNGRDAISTTYDGTVQCWDYKNGTERFTLFFPGEKDWVVTAPSGLFDASPGALENMYFRLGTEIIELEQLKERYYEPGLLQKLLGFSKDPVRSVEGFNSIALYPLVRLRLDTLANKLTFHLSPRSGGLGKVSIFINDKEIIEDANPPESFNKTRDTVGVIDLENYARYFLFDTLNVVSVRAYNQAGWLKSAPKSIEYQPAFARSRGEGDKRSGNAAPLRRLARKPALHAIVVGTSEYAGSQLNLKYSSKDARDIAAAIRQVSSQLFFDSVFIHLLVTDTSDTNLHPTKNHIKAVFEKVQQHAKSEDVLLAYFSGHGVSYGDADQALFYYLTMDISSDNLSDVGVRDSRTVSSAELTRWINDIPAQKQVLILDACNSGRVVENLTGSQKELSSSQIRALDRMKDRTGMFVLTGSAADKVSYEAGQYGQGLLTYSLLQGMSGLALTADKRVDVSTLFEYARDVVPQLAKGIGGVQTPMMMGPLSGSFDVGVVNDQVNIQLPQVKPVFVRNNFMDENDFDDVLGLTNALGEYFQEITVRGAQSDLVYVDVNEYENAYSIKGLYTVNGDAVAVRGRLFQGKAPKGAFTVSGKKTDLQALVEAIVDKVSEML
ncbi:MAG: caspase family protein [Saprospiraceae bacterium]